VSYMATLVKNPRTRALRVIVGCAVTMAAVASVRSEGALAAPAAPAWMILSAQAPTNFPPGDASGQASYLITAVNIGGSATDGSPVVIKDVLPEPLTAITGQAAAASGLSCGGSTPHIVTCSGSPALPPGAVLSVELPVAVSVASPETVVNHVAVEGGGGSPVEASDLTSISDVPASFAFQSFANDITDAEGLADTQAGSHPYSMTTTLNFTSARDGEGRIVPAASPKDIDVDLPSGLIGNPTTVQSCTAEELLNNVDDPAHGCPPGAQVGMVVLREATFLLPNTDVVPVPVYNMASPVGEPAELGFQIANVPVFIDANVRTGGDYGVTASLSEVSAALPVTGSLLTLWGVPADPSHDPQRCALPNAEGICPGGEPKLDPHTAGMPPAPFLTLPTSCEGVEAYAARADTWQSPGLFTATSFLGGGAGGEAAHVDGCDKLNFSPSVSVTPTTSVADSPSGLQTLVSLPQPSNSTGLGEAGIRTVVVELPDGLTANPSAANGLAACSLGEIRLNDSAAPDCPEGSKVGNVEVTTPVLAQPLKGSLFLAAQAENPFGSLLAVYLVAEGSGVLVKLAGDVHADPASGKLTVTFANNPDVPVSEIKVDLVGGPAGVLATPESCGQFDTRTVLTPWSAPESGPPATPSSVFAISSQCVTAFDPSFATGMSDARAGAYGTLRTSLERTDGDQELSGLTLTLPPGMSAKLTGVTLCRESEVASASCPSTSQIGDVEVAAGVGPDPIVLHGKAFLTGPYNGGPFGVAVAVPAVAGPFNLGTVVVRASLRIDARDAHATVISDPFPAIVDGIPVRLRSLVVKIDRPQFALNPTSCRSKTVAAIVSSRQGASSSVTSRFGIEGCRELPFSPKFAASVGAKASKANGVGLHVMVRSARGQANIGRVRVALPKQLPSRLTTLQQACRSEVFGTNPASCPAGALVGTATAVTPLLTRPLVGPAYLVSHGGAAFPNLEIVLQGEGITLILDGQTDIKKGITISTFNSVPDAPVTRFDLALPTGPHSALGANLPAKAKNSFCVQKLLMPTQITGQNEAVIKQTTKVAVSGCPKHRRHSPKHKRAARSRSRVSRPTA
jgi:hypothetical protein